MQDPRFFVQKLLDLFRRLSRCRSGVSKLRTAK